MSVLGFLSGVSASPALVTQQKQKTVEGTKATSTTNPYVSSAELGSVVQGAMQAAGSYYSSASKAKDVTDAVAADTQKKVVEGKENVKVAANQALVQANLQYQNAVAASQTNSVVLQQYASTYGSPEYREQKDIAFKQAMADRDQLLQAQADADSPDFFTAFSGAFMQNRYAQESQQSAALVAQMQAAELNSAAELQNSLKVNEAVAQNATSVQMARATMLANQADTLIKSAKAGIDLNKESWIATSAALGFDQHKSSAAYDKLNAAFKSNELTTSAIRAEQEALQLEATKLSLAKIKKETERSESIYQWHEKSFNDYQAARQIPVEQRVTFSAAVDQQQQTGMPNPLLGEYIDWNNYTKSESKTAISRTVSAGAGAGRVPQTAADLKRVEWLKSYVQRRSDEITQAFYTKKGVKDSTMLDSNARDELQAELSQLQAIDAKGNLNSKLLTEADAAYAEDLELADKDLNVGNAKRMTGLPDADTMVQALGIKQQMIAAGADPEIVALVQSGKAENIKLSIPAEKKVSETLNSVTRVFAGTLSDEDIANPSQFPAIAQAAAKYYATAQSKFRTHQTVRDAFPNWSNSTAVGNKLMGESDINIENPASLQPIFMQALIQERLNRYQSNGLGNIPRAAGKLFP